MEFRGAGVARDVLETPAGMRVLLALMVLGSLAGCTRDIGLPGLVRGIGRATKVDDASSPCAEGETFTLRVPREAPAVDVLANPLRPRLPNMTRDHLLHYLDGFYRGPLPASVQAEEGDATLTLECEHVFPSVRDALREVAPSERYFDVLAKVRDLLEEGHYEAARNFERASWEIPEHVDGLAALGFRDWTGQVVPQSIVKDATRALYCSPPGSPHMSIAQTHDSTTGDRNTPVRETELIVEREDGSGAYDYFVYDAEGWLARESTFTGSAHEETIGSAPYTCSTCHYHPEQRRFQNRPLTFGGLDYPQRLGAAGCGERAGD